METKAGIDIPYEPKEENTPNKPSKPNARLAVDLYPEEKEKVLLAFEEKFPRMKQQAILKIMLEQFTGIPLK